MREIKFRVWYDGKIRNGDSIIAVRRFIEVAPQSVSTFALDSFFKELQREGYCFIQFTGLHDKNGKEIYEGDIVKRMPPFSERIGAVNYHTGSAQFRVDWRYGPDYTMNGNYEMADVDVHNWEVIGNIYENPDLLSVN